MTSLFNNINDILKKKKKNRRMRILEHRIFLSLLAGKFSAFEQVLLTEPTFFKKRRTRIVSAVFFFSGKIQNF